MHNWLELTSDEIAELDRNLPVIIPVGLVEAHGPHLAVSVDVDTAEYFATEVAKRTGSILAPVMPYGFSDEMSEYPGSIGVTAGTFQAVVKDICLSFCSHGFKKIIFITGHGANKSSCELAFYKVWEEYTNFKGVCWNWWSDCGISGVHHANKEETEVAIAVGTISHMDRVNDFNVDKPWYKIRSRYALNPESGGINGTPSEADIENGKKLRDEALEVLTSKVIEAVING